MKKLLRKLTCVFVVLCACVAMALPAFAADNVQPRLQACPNCNRGGVLTHEELISSSLAKYQDCAHNHFGYSDAIYHDTYQTVYTCTACNWEGRSSTYIKTRVVCLFDYVG